MNATSAPVWSCVMQHAECRFFSFFFVLFFFGAACLWQAGAANLRQPGRAVSQTHEHHLHLGPQRGHHLLHHRESNFTFTCSPATAIHAAIDSVVLDLSAFFRSVSTKWICMLLILNTHSKIHIQHQKTTLQMFNMIFFLFLNETNEELKYLCSSSTVSSNSLVTRWASLATSASQRTLQATCWWTFRPIWWQKWSVLALWCLWPSDFPWWSCLAAKLSTPCFLSSRWARIWPIPLVCTVSVLKTQPHERHLHSHKCGWMRNWKLLLYPMVYSVVLLKAPFVLILQKISCDRPIYFTLYFYIKIKHYLWYKWLHLRGSMWEYLYNFLWEQGEIKARIVCLQLSNMKFLEDIILCFQ